MNNIGEGRVGFEDPIRYDGLAGWIDETTGKRYSRNGNPMDDDELSKWGKIYKVEQVRIGDGPYNYDYKILSSRDDN